MPDGSGGTPRTPGADGKCNQCDDCTECPKCKGNINKTATSGAVKDFKVTDSRQSSRGGNDKEDECKRDTNKEVKEDPLVKWFPDHISKDPMLHPLIPYPKPPLKVELRGGNLIHYCHCLRRNGMQSECPHTGCQGSHDCMQRFLPDCIPSGLKLPPKKQPFVQKGDQPECYSKPELAKAYEKVMSETLTGGSGGIEGDREKPKKGKPESKVVMTKPPSLTDIISEKSKEEGAEDSTKKKKVRIRPNSPPNYINSPALDALPAPCRRHATTGILLGKYGKFTRCRLKKGKTVPKVIAPVKSRESLNNGPKKSEESVAAGPKKSGETLAEGPKKSEETLAGGPKKSEENLAENPKKS